MNTSWMELAGDVGSDPRHRAVRDAIYSCELVAAAVVIFDFFTWLDKAPADPDTIRSSWKLTDRTADVMLTLFSAMGLVEKRQDLFSLTENAPHILHTLSEWYRDQAAFAGRPVHGVIREVLRTGKPAHRAKDEKQWTEMMKDESFARSFLKTMDSQGSYLAPSVAAHLDLRDRRRLLDIAGGSGTYACHIVQQHRHIQATVFERTPADSVALEYIAARGCSGSVDVAAGDIFSEQLPEGYDVHLWSNALHDWDAPTVQQLIVKSYDALPDGGMIVIHDSHLNRTKIGPLPIANFSVFLMTSTEGKCYSVAEIERFVTEARFNDAICRDTILNHSIITAIK